MTFNAYSIFGEDIRTETENKYSLMGIYTGDMIVAQMPTMIQRMAICSGLQFSINYPIPEDIKFRVLLMDKTLSSVTIGKSSLINTRDQLLLENEKHPELDPVEKIHINCAALLQSIEVKEQSVLRTEFVVDGEIVLAGKLRIKARQ